MPKPSWMQRQGNLGMIEMKQKQDTASVGRKKPKKMGVRRKGRYHLLKIVRLRATPHAIAVGVAAGAFAAFLPFIGVHMAMSVGIAWLFGGNLISATASTVLIGNPLTYPLIWGATWEAGEIILGSGATDKISIDLHNLFHSMSFSAIWNPILKPMLVGSLPFALAAAGVGYLIALQAIRIFRAGRKVAETSHAESR